MSWLTEGVSARSTWGRPDPVIHLLVEDGKRLWCSGGAGRAEVHHANETETGRLRFHWECRALAQQALDDGTLSPDDSIVRKWRLRVPAATASSTNRKD